MIKPKDQRDSAALNADNRIPRISKPVNLKIPELTHEEFLLFKDWTATNELENSGWLSVARLTKDERENRETELLTYSVLTSNVRKNIKKILCNPEQFFDYLNWDTFGKPGIVVYCGKEEYENGQTEIIQDIEFAPFVYYRFWNTKKRSYFDLLHSFLLLNDAHFDTETSQYLSDDENGNHIPIAKMIVSEAQNELLVDKHTLRRFLSTTKQCLIRFHFHTRVSNQPLVQGAPGDIAIQDNLSESDRTYNVTARNCHEIEIVIDGNRLSRAKLVGADILHPYASPRKKKHEESAQFSSYIVGLGGDGRSLETTCNPAKLSDYFTDKGLCHFLTPVYFDIKLLTKYYQEPQKYEVSSGHIECGSFWNIDISVTEENLIQVWLGDLGKCLPYEEQCYWRTYNVRPSGSITEDRYQRDLEGKFRLSKQSIMEEFLGTIKSIQQTTNKLHGFSLFLPLHEKDAHVVKTLHLPLSNEQKEFDEFTLYLAKMIVDSINADLLTKLTGKKIDGENYRGSLDLLQAYLAQLGVSRQDQDVTIGSLRNIQNIRSSSSAHRKGTKFDQLVSKAALKGLSNRQLASKLLTDTLETLKRIKGFLG